MIEFVNKNALLNRFKRVFEKNKEYHVADGLAMAYDMIQGEPTIDAIPIEWIWRYWDDGDKPKNYALHIRDMIEAWREEQEEE